MKTIPRVLLLFLLPLWSVAHADVWVGKSDVTFKGYSTLHDFEGTVTAVPLQVTVEDAMEADETFSMLMGEIVLPRKRFIQTHAAASSLYRAGVPSWHERG